MIDATRDVVRAFRIAVRRARADRILRSRFPKLTFGEDVLVRGVERFFPAGYAFLDNRVYLNCAGGDWNGNSGFIKLGNNSEIGAYSVLWGAGGITIGSNVHLGAMVVIAAHEATHIAPDVVEVFEPLKMEFAPVNVGDHTLIASGSVIIPGVSIGHHSMIGAGSVVVNDIPPYSLAVGCPARVVRTLRPGSTTDVPLLDPMTVIEGA